MKFTRPPNASGWIAAYYAGAERTDIENLVTRTAAAGTRWHTIEERDEHALSATYYRDEQQPDGSPTQTANALYAEYERHWRRVDDLIAPTTGWMVSAFAGGGVPGISTRNFGRLRGRFAAWLPLGEEQRARFSRGSRRSARRQSQRHSVDAAVPHRREHDGARLRFREPGRDQNGAVVPGRYYAVASIDATHWINESWGLAAFLDAGNAVDSLSDAHLALGYGLGARIRTPLGPFRLDVAYGQDVRQVRVQFSVGLTF